MSGLRKKARDTLTNRLQQPGVMPKAQRIAGKAVSLAQRRARAHPRLARLYRGLERRAVLQPSTKRPGSGRKTPLGSGKGGAIALTHPGADSSARPGTPGEILYGEEPVEINTGRDVITVTVVNTGDRPVMVGSHYHFAEVNPALSFDRRAARGRRQNIVSGGMTRFDPGVSQEVELIPFAGQRVAAGFRGETGGPTDA